MSAETDFLNFALGTCGQTRITAIDDGSIEANWCAVFYAPLRKALLAQTYWAFATHRATLNAGPTPAFEFSNSFGLPADLLGMREYNGVALTYIPQDPMYWTYVPGRYKIEGRYLLTNDTECKIVYLRDITNPALWSSLFYIALGTHLSSHLALVIGKDSTKSSALLSEFQAISLPSAAAVNGQQDSPAPPYSVQDLTWGRR